MGRSSVTSIVACGSLLGLLACGCSSKNQVSTTAPVAVAPTTLSETPDEMFNAEAHFVAGQSAQSENRLDAAADHYGKALSQNPQFMAAAYHLGVVCAHLQRYPDALDAFWTYVSLTRESAAAYASLGYCYELAGRIAEAEAAYKRGLLRDPAHEPCRVNYGLMLARLGREEESLAQLTIVLKPAEAHYNLASIYELQGKKDKAREEYSKALRLDRYMWEAQARIDALSQPEPPVASAGG